MTEPRLSLDTAVKAAALLGAYAYAVSYFALSNYYGRFGLTPEDDGVTQTTLVARAAVSFLLFGLVLILFALSMAGTLRWARQTGAVREWVLAVVGAVAAVASAYTPTVAFLILFPLAGGLLFGAVAAWVLRRLPDEDEPSWPGRFTAAIALVVVAFLGAWFLESAAESLGREAYDHETFAPDGLAENIFRLSYGVKFRSVDLGANTCAHLIARSGDWAWVLEGPADRRRVRPVPVKDVVILKDEPCQTT
jgi:hypothetical protein